MRILVSGSHGLVGQALIRSLANEGHETVRLVRQAREAGAREVEWQPEKGVIDNDNLEGLDAVVHLAGENIASGRWSDDKKRKIRESRVNGTELLSKSLAKLSKPPSTLVSASAIGIYGNRSDEVLTEESSAGTDFLAQVCVDWEKATAPADQKDVRVVLTRFGIILDKDGGALKKMLTPFQMGVGGRVGSGKQWMSWIALDDVVNALKFALSNNAMSGPVNFVAPNPVTNAEFTETLGRVLSRPTIFPIPAFGVRLAFGEMADALLLASQRVTPEKLKQQNYRFEFPDLKPALSHLLNR